jgi:hypothetical protein
VARDNGQYTFAKWEDSSINRTRTITPGSGTTQLLAYYNVTAESTIPALVGNMFKYITPPDSSAIFQVQNRAGIEEIQNGINAFTLHSGPADVPAFYDFHNLKIAFERVWQELFDDDIIKQAKNLYTDLVELGIDPNEYNETSIPPTVAAEFGITQETWSYLSPELRQELYIEVHV